MRCIKCRDNGVGRKRASLGHLICKPCGEVESVKQRQSWTVVQEYGKGCYQFVTPTTAFNTLRNTNQKETRGTL
jgi:transcription elongation factor Elf1